MNLRQGQAINALPKLKASEKWVIGAYTGMIAGWLFDFRAQNGSGGGSALQAAFLVISLLSITVFIVSERRLRFYVPGMKPWVMATVWFTLVSVVTGILRGNDYYEVFRMALGPLLYLAGGILTIRLIGQIDLVWVRRRLAVLCLLALLSGVVVPILQGGISIETVRYQIIGASIPLALGYASVLVMFSMEFLELGAAAAGVMVIFISVTRSYLVAVAIELLPLWPRLKEMITPRFVIGAFLIVLGAALFLTYDSSGLDRWNQRLNGGQQTARGEDFTWLTRQSENDYMLDHLTESFDSFLLGNGIAAHTIYYNPKEVGGGAEYSIGFGHNQHISQLFVAGIIGGGPLLILQILQAIGGFSFLFKLANHRRLQSNALFLSAWGASGIIILVTDNMFSSAFGARGASLWYGVATGLYLGGRAWLHPRNARLAKPAEELSSPALTSRQPAPYVPPAVQRRWDALD